MESVLRDDLSKGSLLDGKAGILLLLGAGLAIRETFASFTGHPFDFELWLRLGYYTSLGHDPYTATDQISGLRDHPEISV
jgi:hypothetical protein